MSPHETPGREVPPDVEIARAADLRPLEGVAADLDLGPDDVEPRGDGVGKLTWDAIERVMAREPTGALVLVTAMTPTRRGAGKTVTSVGLGQALTRLGASNVVAIREPSQGPVFGIKGGAAGGGYAQVLPMTDINLHFTGDLHAVTSAHNLIAAALDAHVHHGNDLDVDPDRVHWPRVLDVNDRALRETVVGLGGASNGPPREATFRITAASEVMAILCLATDVADLRDRLARAIVARTRDGDPVTVAALGVAGAATALLTDALRPNLVQTIEGSPAFVHGGPFANIAHGTSSVLADHLGRRLADVVVTEAGFGADLGAEKFLDIVARDATLAPDATVLVATVDALLAHGGVDDREATPADARTEAIRRGLANLDHHVDVLRSFGLPVVVALNRFPLDTDAEVDVVLDHCESRGVPAAVSTVHADGGAGGVHLARLVREATRESTTVEPLYDLSASLREKLATVATEVYGADGVAYSDDALAALDYLEAAGLADGPVCVSKAPTSLSEDPDRTGVPEGWTLHVRDLYPAAGAGFVVALTGDVVTMPGLPAHPAALDIDVTPAGDVTGLF